jgi:hypothetical protein
MPSATRQGNILQIGDTIRIESGPVLRQAEATTELLANDQTADHYQAPRKATADEIADANVLTDEGQRLFLDAKGQPIRLGEPMHYLDWLGHGQQDEGATGFYVYALEPMTAAERKARHADAPDELIWHEIGCEPSEEAAITVATDYLLRKGA